MIIIFLLIVIMDLLIFASGSIQCWELLLSLTLAWIAYWIIIYPRVEYKIIPVDDLPYWSSRGWRVVNVGRLGFILLERNNA